MPDWRKASGYRFPENFPDYRWAWEFLRRNKEYRKDWTDALARIRGREAEFSHFPRVEEILTDEGMIRTTRVQWDDPEHPDFWIPIRARDRWGLVFGLLNPDTDNPEKLSFWGLGRAVILHESSKNLSPVGPRFPWAPFDLALPLKPQAEALLKTLEREQRESGYQPRIVKHHREQWPHYLRLLDADLDGRSPRRIADVLQHEIDGLDEKKVWDRLKKAKEMTQPSGYLSIFRSSSEISVP